MNGLANALQLLAVAGIASSLWFLNPWVLLLVASLVLLMVGLLMERR